MHRSRYTFFFGDRLYKSSPRAASDWEKNFLTSFNDEFSENTTKKIRSIFFEIFSKKTLGLLCRKHVKNAKNRLTTISDIFSYYDFWLKIAKSEQPNPYLYNKKFENFLFSFFDFSVDFRKYIMIKRGENGNHGRVERP